MNKDLVNFIAKHYLESDDFNGFPVRNLIKAGLNEKVLRNLLSELVKSDQITLLFEDSHTNPHIKAFPPDSIEKQVEKILKNDLTHTCAYPTPSYLASFVNQDDYKNTPFTLRLALGEPQLSYLSFDLSVLESYRNDPRYYYWNNDISGKIYSHSDIADSIEISESDKVFLQTFGFSYDNNMNRAVAVFLIYLHQLSPEHQQIWNSKLLKGEYKLHPDYYRASIKGNPAEGISVFSAFLGELKVINEMAKLMSREQLFTTILENDNKPREFTFLIRPTLKEYNEFVHLLDKLISDNINKEFFKDDVPLETEEKRRDGKIIVRPKNTISILEDWINKYFKTDDTNLTEEMFSAFREIRKLRQKPAHVVEDNVFDQKYFKAQRVLITKAHHAISTLHQILSCHPATKDYELPRYLKSSKIWTY